MTVERVNVLGVGIAAVDMPRALALVRQAAHTPGFVGYVTLTGVHGVMASQDDASLKRIHNRAYLALPDGIPMVWLGRRRGFAMGQVAGPDFMRAMLAGEERHFLFGAGPGVVDKIAAKNIVGRMTPPFPVAEGALIEAIERTRPHLVWVGLSTPTQERFMAEFVQKHAARLRSDEGVLFAGTGAAFDFLAGTAKEAPRVLRGTGLEWMYRMLQEPRRLTGRYLRNNPRFVLGVAKQALFPHQFPLA